MHLVSATHGILPYVGWLTNPRVGHHYFIPNPITGQGLSPKWDLTSQGPYKGNAEAYVVAARAGGAPAPVPTRDVDWLALNSVKGSLATQVYRTDTRGGHPPASVSPQYVSPSPVAQFCFQCKPGETKAVKYVSKYCKFTSLVSISTPIY